MYALLGGTIRPQPEGITLQVVTSPAPISKFESCLGRDQAWFGLPNEFAPSALEGMRNAAQSHPALPGAAVLCNLAAFTEIGSSNLVFKVLGQAVVHLLLTPGTPDQNEIASLLTLETPSETW